MKKTNPIIEGFLSAKEPLGVVLEKYCHSDQPLESAFLSLSKESPSNAINLKLIELIDIAIIEGHPDSNLYLFFICMVVSYYHKHNQKEKVKSLLLIGASVTSDEITPFIKAVFISNLAINKRWEGEIEECNQLMKKCISFVDRAEPRANVLIQNYMTNIALSGKLKDKNQYQLEELNGLTPQNYLMASSIIKIINCIITGNTQEGFAVYDECKNHKDYIPENNFETYYSLLKISTGDFNEANYTSSDDKYMANAFQYFLSGKYEQSLKYYALLNDNYNISNMNLSFSYLPLHLELINKKSGKARLLLKDKKEKGDVFYLDDLFYGRLQLLENDDSGAEESFSRLIENVNRFGAMKRLEFELQFAKEMNLPLILRLLKGWKLDNQSPTQKQKTSNSPKAKENQKGVNLLIGKSKLIFQIKDLVKKYASISAPVLVTGETGTGKELVSRAIHEEGLFSKEPFLAINCGALTETLLQSELFGYEAGAFTGAQKQRKGIFEAAGKGTVFLDEFGDISPKLQVSLLRVLEANEIRMIGSTVTQKIECKIVIATNVDLHEAVVAKKFREDLFFRLARFEIKIPSLRERKEDIPELINYFLTANSVMNRYLSNELLNALLAYHWPGNIRELKNEIERLNILNPGIEKLDLEHFDFTHLQVKPKVPNKNDPIANPIESKILEQIAQDDSYLKIIQSGFRIEKRHLLIKELFKKHQKLTRSQIMKIANIGPTTATKDLQILMNTGFIVRRTPTKSTSTHYFEMANN
jgi:transcriptional regulator with PAS, ATPase and Fis domain